MLAKITAYNNNIASGGCSDFSMNVYWGDDYRSEFYLCGDLGRSTFEDVIETNVDATGQATRTQNSSIERFNLSVVVSTPLLQFLKSIDKCDVKQLTFLDTGDVYNITNLDIEDNGSNLDPIQLVNIIFEDEPITKVQDNQYVDLSAKLAFWDNDRNGTPDIDGEAEYSPLIGAYVTSQLYFEADGVTPATSGNVQILAYAVRDNVENLIGIFNGEFGDVLVDASKWQTTQNIYNYFNVFSSTIGHTLTVLFDKEAFAVDNGYYSDEVEDRAVKIRFDLSIDGSAPQPTTLELAYTVRGAFSASRVQNPTTGVYGITTIGKTNQKNTLSTIQDIIVPLGGGSQTLVTNPSLSATNNFSNRYTLGIAPSGENSYTGLMVTAGGYSSNNFRGAKGTKNFNFALLETAPVQQSVNVLNFTIGNNPKIITFTFQYFRDLGGFPLLGDIPAAGDAEILLDGTLVNTVPAIAPSTLQVIATQNITLPDTDVHKITLTLPTDQGYDIFTDFEVQLKPLF